MPSEMLDAMVSLTALMEEESAGLAGPGHFAKLGEVAAAKSRLVGRLEATIARLTRERPDWLEALAPAARSALADATRDLRDASTVNAQILTRQIALTSDMMDAIAAEAQRLTGRQSETYGARGRIRTKDESAPIALNTRF